MARTIVAATPARRAASAGATFMRARSRFLLPLQGAMGDMLRFEVSRRLKSICCCAPHVLWREGLRDAADTAQN